MDTDVIEAAVATTDADAGVAEPTTLTPEELTAEDLIEEVSIDGMCGVY